MRPPPAAGELEVGSRPAGAEPGPARSQLPAGSHLRGRPGQSREGRRARSLCLSSMPAWAPTFCFPRCRRRLHQPACLSGRPPRAAAGPRASVAMDTASLTGLASGLCLLGVLPDRAHPPPLLPGYLLLPEGSLPFHSFLHSFSQMTNIYRVPTIRPGTVLGAVDAELNRRIESLPSWRLYSSEEER